MLYCDFFFLLVNTSNEMKPESDFCVNSLQPQSDPNTQKNVDVTQQHTVYRSNDGRLGLWTHFKVYSEGELTVLLHDHKTKKVNKKKTRIIEIAFCGPLTSTSVWM